MLFSDMMRIFKFLSFFTLILLVSVVPAAGSAFQAPAGSRG